MLRHFFAASQEGDNTILSLQSGRSLIGSYSDALKGTKLPLGTAYLNALPSVLTFASPANAAAVTELETIDRGWACVAANAVKKAHDVFEGLVKSGQQKDEALEGCSQERFVAAKVHTTGYIFR